MLTAAEYIAGFAGLVTVASIWNIFGGDMFPAEKDPTGDPNKWTETELRRWLKNRNLTADLKLSREELIERVKANLRV
ncbi:STE24 endopeptidase [Exophiala aquamarina CBS 119918]|uniref:STE24 endopeptidase n=1 Tax=Exophiala aquamarina CBS 119918 TaxID=1182545 RepID=A0A072NWU9_9EURO|nr:STE24 endopeptidase [Exophiala aquamarina CBS 119918]KEF51902.1 STE24 endopeptidase [Exophiala aquamarina CBS 119918]